jgi:hypothetical protein
MSLSTVGQAHALTHDTFRDFVEQNDMVLVGFVLPFLPVFQRFVKEYQEVALPPMLVDVQDNDKEGVLGISTIA